MFVTRLLGAVLLCVAALVVTPAVAGAATPNWSGLDARHYDGPIPAPGELIRAVPLDPALSITGAGSAYRILYSTTDQHDRPAVGTAAVFVPKGVAPQGGWPVIAWAHGTVGLGDDCTPSAKPRSDRDDEYLSHWLDQGYVVVGADYAGLGTPGLMSYLNGITTAHGIVDSVLAAHHLDLPLSPRWAVVGQSQGGGAAIDTARWATEFSAGSGLDYRGVVATGTPANVVSLVQRAGPDMQVPDLAPIANAYTAYIVAALREAGPELDLDAVLTPAGRAAADQAETLCTHDLADALADMTIPGFFTAPVASIPGFDAFVQRYMGTPQDGFDRPIFLGVGLQDRDVPPELTLKFHDTLVANGQDVTLKVYPDDDHSSAVLASMADSTPWLRGQFAD
ncbi:prolyl oligopeptidase family serine peptidase [Mycolicibacterium sp.]|uniref:alpha/beta hydrolase family protein n=1 Tax=Mycolicibacterium sp. TaxID=2320850 RepID=UPI0035604213